MVSALGFKVVVDRDACIACGVCASTCPDVFEMSPDDGKSRIVESLRAGSESVGNVPDELRGCVENAASSCPVGAIRIEG